MSNLTPPVHEKDHSQGPTDAPITLVEYGDYECPHCGHAYPIIKKVQEQMGSKLRFVFRNFPLSNAHQHAANAAEAAESAASQGKFWEMHDLLFENQHSLEDQSLKEYAQDLDLDAAKFNQDLAKHRYRERVQQDFSSGVRSGVNGTPTFFINGTRYDGPWNLQSLLRALKAAAKTTTVL
jgi:protein-disulfide isomerase